MVVKKSGRSTSSYVLFKCKVSFETLMVPWCSNDECGIMRPWNDLVVKRSELVCSIRPGRLGWIYTSCCANQHKIFGRPNKVIPKAEARVVAAALCARECRVWRICEGSFRETVLNCSGRS